MARDKNPDPRRLDVRAFAAAGATLEGRWPQHALARLAESLVAGDAPRPVAWRVAGEHGPLAGGAPRDWLHLTADTMVALQCQRCLQPLVEPLAVDRRFCFVEREEDAERLDEEIDDDVLVASKAFDLQALVEDELILALPIVPRHEICPEPLPTSAGDEVEVADEKPNPFAALAALKKS